MTGENPAYMVPGTGGTRELAILIDDPETERLIRELAELTGEPVENAIKVAVRERLERLGSAEGKIGAGARRPEASR